MSAVNDIVSSVEFLKFAVPLLGAVIAWFANEWRKRIADQYQRKEASYREMLRSLRGYYVGAENAKEMRLEFLNQLTTSWLYCPDQVIRKGYAFLDTVHATRVHTDEEKELALGEFVAAARRDILSRNLVRRTTLNPRDFKHLGVK